jgi:hypothetical protein
MLKFDRRSKAAIGRVLLYALAKPDFPLLLGKQPLVFDET